MAVENRKSTSVTNGDATSFTLNNKRVEAAIVKESVGTIALANGDSIASVLRFVRVPSSVRVTEIRLYCDAVTSAAMDFGVYRTAADGGAVVDADLFASAVSIATAITTGTPITYESGVYGIEDAEQPLWQALGLSADPKVQYDLAGTLTAATTAAGDVTIKVRYCDGN
jgi:hypothetical protein